MAYQGALYPSTASSSGAYGSWTNVNNVKVDDGNYASGDVSNIGNGGTANYIAVSDYGFSIPTGSTIDGILVEFKRYGANVKSPDGMLVNHPAIMKAGSIVATKAGTDTWPTSTPAYVSYGGPTDLWGQSWTASDINNSGFGAQIAAVSTTGGTSSTAFIDAIRIKVWYTPPVSTLTSLGYNFTTENFTTTSTSVVDVTDLDVEVTVPSGGRALKITAFCPQILSSQSAGNVIDMYIREGSTTLEYSRFTTPASNYGKEMSVVWISDGAVSAGTHTFKVSVYQQAAGTLIFVAATDRKATIEVEAYEP